MTEFTITSSKIHTLKSGDPGFQIIDGFTTANRASVEISARCPENIRDLIALALKEGWIKPVAYITEREKLFMGLTGA
jgi:hypothetical protein